MKKISIVIPTFNEKDNIPELIPDIVKNIPQKYLYEIIFVDDNSPDGTFLVIEKLARTNNKIKGISMYRRYGLQPSLAAGIENSTGDAIITMDADFQHPPQLIPDLISLWEKGYDLIQPKKQEDNSLNIFTRALRKIGYKIWEKVSNGVLIPGVSEYRLFDKKIADSIIKSQESELFIRGLIHIAANNPTTIPYKVGKRKHGHSSFNIFQLINIFMVGFISFNTKPLRILWILGLFIAVFTTIFLIIDILVVLIQGKGILAGWATLVFLSLIFNGFIVFYLGILGEYVGIIFKEVKKRPLYIIGHTINLK